MSIDLCNKENEEFAETKENCFSLNGEKAKPAVAHWPVDIDVMAERESILGQLFFYSVMH